MKYLLDTHVLLWWLDKNSPMTQKVRDFIDNPATAISVSVVSVWEISIKQALGKFRAPDDFIFQVKSNMMTILPINFEHAFAVRSLPRLHGDPFDRMLVTQAMLEDLTIITHDKNVQAYSVSCMMV